MREGTAKKNQLENDIFSEYESIKYYYYRKALIICKTLWNQK